MFNSIYFNRSPSQLRNIYYPVKSEGSIQCKDGSFDFSDKSKEMYPKIKSQKKITILNKKEFLNPDNQNNLSRDKSRLKLATSSYKPGDAPLTINKKVIFSKLNLEALKTKDDSILTDSTPNSIMTSLKSFMYTSREKFIKENKKHINFFKSRDRSPPPKNNIKLLNSVNLNRKIKIIKPTQTENKEKKKMEIHQHPIVFPETISAARQRNNRQDVKLPFTSRSREIKSFFLNEDPGDASIMGSPLAYSKRSNFKQPNFLYRFSNFSSQMRNGVLYTQFFKVKKGQSNFNELLGKVHNTEAHGIKSKAKLQI